MKAHSMNSAPSHDPWLNPADDHDDGCDGHCHAGYCAERINVLEHEEVGE
jgi:hypothetical protein